MSKIKYDIVVFGATSFVGELICEYMIKQVKDESITWALAGRSVSKLNDLKTQLGDENIPVIVADANDLKAMTNLCQQAQVVMSTVGPYDLYGETLIQACVQTGTDYCDLTGEAHWIKKMLDRYEDQAKTSGARIVHCTGFDSIPSDLGVFHLQQAAKEQFDNHCHQVKLRIKNMRGAASGGTIATALNIAKQIKADPQVKRHLINPYSLCPEGHGFTVRQHEVGLEYDDTFQKWTAPFFMSSINTKIVHRSNALSGHSYGSDFSYNEGMMTGPGFKGKLRARSIYWGLAAFFTGIGIGPIRSLLKKFFLPKPGEGPSKPDQEAGFYDFRFVGTTSEGQQIITQVLGDMDPGYGSTAKIMSQAAFSMVKDVAADDPGGFWTPATLLGKPLIDRLHEKAGVTFKVISS